MKVFIVASMALLLVAGCKKKDITYTVEGVITDSSFNQPLNGATVTLYQVPIGGTTPTDVLATAQTGNDGKYHFEFKRDRVEKYIIKIEKNNYFPVTHTFYQDDMSTKETNYYTHTTTAKAWAALHFVNTDPDQDLKFQRQTGKSGCEECCEGSPQFLYGAVDTVIYCINDGNYDYGYYYWVLNTAINGPESTNTTAFDTTEILLNY